MARKKAVNASAPLSASTTTPVIPEPQLVSADAVARSKRLEDNLWGFRQRNKKRDLLERECVHVMATLHRKEIPTQTMSFLEDCLAYRALPMLLNLHHPLDPTHGLAETLEQLRRDALMFEIGLAVGKKMEAQ